MSISEYKALTSLRDKDNQLVVKDMLDIDFNMYVKEEQGNFFVQVNQRYRLDENYTTQKAAEDAMLKIAGQRNQLEESLKGY